MKNKKIKHTSKPVNIGIKAISFGLNDGGCSYVTNFPGTYSHDIFSFLGGKQISVNEKVAFEMAYGASLAGSRSVCCLKNVGLNVAADPFLNSMISGVNAGLVVVLIDDVEVVSSQARMDSRHYLDFYGGLWLEPTSIEQAYEFAYQAFEWSELFDVPVVIRLTNQFFNLNDSFVKKTKKKKKFKLAKGFGKKFIVHPTYWRSQFENLNKKNKKIQDFVDSLYDRSNLNNKKIISFGNSQREIKKSNISENDLFNIYSYPSPEFIKDMKISAIFEQGDNYGFEKISKERFHYKSSVGDLDIDYKYRVWSELEKLFFALKNINPDYVVSELTQFTRETANVIDSCLCLGSGVAVASGIAETGVKYPIVVSGDTSFLHGMGFLEAIYRKLNLGLIIIENGGSWCTGGQQQLINNIDFCSKMGVSFKILDYKKTTQQDIEKELLKMKKKAELFVLFIKKDK